MADGWQMDGKCMAINLRERDKKREPPDRERDRDNLGDREKEKERDREKERERERSGITTVYLRVHLKEGPVIPWHAASTRGVPMQTNVNYVPTSRPGGPGYTLFH